MRFVRFQLIVIAVFFITTAHAQDGGRPIYFTNQTAVANGNTVLSAVLSGDSQSKTNVQALVGAQVIFVGLAVKEGTGNLLVKSNIFVEVELKPWRDVYENEPFARQNYAEVLGTLASVDFEKRVVHIQAKPKDWLRTVSY